jgi:hypothetical protein
MFFLLFLLDDRRIRIREVQKHMDPTDPEHCVYVWLQGKKGKHFSWQKTQKNAAGQINDLPLLQFWE